MTKPLLIGLHTLYEDAAAQLERTAPGRFPEVVAQLRAIGVGEAVVRPASTKLKTCPWCNELPTVEPWHGGGPQKHMVHCETETCEAGPGVTGKTRELAIEKWNRRTGEAP